MIQPNWHTKFLEFHRDNPHVYVQLVDCARQVKARGKTRYSIKGLFEVVRFREDTRTTGKPFKLNNNYTAYFARKIMEENPDLDGFFKLRETRAPH